jgi:hypothetical protein
MQSLDGKMTEEIHDIVIEALVEPNWRVYYGDEILIDKCRDPEFSACWELRQRGKTGTLRVKHKKSAHYSMTVPIEAGALASLEWKRHAKE